MDPKLTLFFLLIGAIVSFSHLNDGMLARVRRPLRCLVRREYVKRKR